MHFVEWSRMDEETARLESLSKTSFGESEGIDSDKLDLREVESFR